MMVQRLKRVNMKKLFSKIKNLFPYRNKYKLGVVKWLKEKKDREQGFYTLKTDPFIYGELDTFLAVVIRDYLRGHVKNMIGTSMFAYRENPFGYTQEDLINERIPKEDIQRIEKWYKDYVLETAECFDKYEKHLNGAYDFEFESNEEFEKNLDKAFSRLRKIFTGLWW